jgi:drug/metabolite transporter (DMT)-like permease
LGRAGNYVLYNAGLAQLPSNAATITAPVQTVVVILLARIFVGERVRTRWLGLLLSVGGLLLIWWNGQGWETLADPRFAWGNLSLVLAGAASAVQYTSQKVLSPRLSSLEILIPVFAWSSVVHLPFSWAAGGLSQTYDTQTWVLLLFLGLVLTGGSYFFLAEGYRRCAATTSVAITNTTIFFTLIWSSLLLRERVSAIMVLGALVVVVGAVALVRADRRAITEPSSQRRAGLAERSHG